MKTQRRRSPSAASEAEGEYLVEEEPRTELDFAQRVRQLREAEESLKRSREELAAKEREIRERSLELQHLAEELVRREDEVAARELALLTAVEQRSAGAVEGLADISGAPGVVAGERRLAEEARRLKEVAAQLRRREEEYAEKVRRFNIEAEAELRRRVNEILRRGRGGTGEGGEFLAREEEVRKREASLAAREDELRRKEANLLSREESLGKRESEIKAMEEELRRLKEETSEKAKELRRLEEELVQKSGALAEKEAMAKELDELRGELERRREEVRAKEKEVKVRFDEAERRYIELKEREERVRGMEEEVVRRDTEVRRREEEVANKEAEVLRREEAVEKKEAELRDREEGLRAKEEELRVERENLEAMKASMEAQRAAGAAEELEERARLLDERERALEQFNQELRAAEAINQKKEMELEERRRALEEAEAALQEKEKALAMETEALAADREAFSQREAEFLRQRAELEKFQEYLRTRALELDGTQKIQDRREESLKEEEGRISALRAELEKKKEELEALEKDLRYHEIHLLTLEEEIADCPYCSTMDGFITTMQLIADAKGLGADVTEAERYHKQARQALESGDFDKAATLNRNAMTLAKEAKQKYLHYGVKYIISGAETAVKSASQMGVDTSECEEMLKSAREALDRGEYESAEELARRAERTAILAEEKLRELVGTLERIETRLKEIQSYGVDLSEVESAVSAAKELMRERKRKEAQERLQGVEEIMLLSFRRHAAKLRDEARDLVMALKAENAEAGDAELFLGKAEEALLEGEYGKCIQCASEALRLANEARSAGAPGVVETRTMVPQTQAPAPAPGAVPGLRRGRVPPRVVAATMRIQGGEAGPRQPSAPAVAIPRGPASPGTPPGEYECPGCRSHFSVEDRRRPVLTKCPGCSMLLQLL
ncbi:MAG: DUF4398 domain-containing protein [Thermoplasmata archaeon]